MNIKKLQDGAYDPKSVEAEMLKYWRDNKFFKPETQKDTKGTFSMVLPPPNANAPLHVGHVSGYAVMDLLARYHRMKGEKVLLIPGKDHAGILTEIVFEKELVKQGTSKRKLGRDEFYKQCYNYSMKMAENARNNEEKVGLSADFERDTFTLDPDIVKTVLGTFMKLYEDGLIYKGAQIVNWDPKAQSTLADIDTERQAIKAKLYYIKYSNEITVATTRPETMFGDTAVAINPTDERYKKLIGTKIKLPLTDREIPIIYSGRIEKEFGTGCLKVTPAHAPDDYTIMNEWNIEAENKGLEKIGYVNVIDKFAKLLPITGEFSGLKTLEAREKVVAKLTEMGLIEKIEEIDQNIVVGERTKAIIEPLISRQWFVNVKKLKEKAIEVLKEKDGKKRLINVHPENMHEKMLTWLENLRDWPISRSLWWGYRIPVWYKGESKEYYDDLGQLKYEEVETKVQLESPGEGWIQDEDVLDTWFSSGQWAYATLMKYDLLEEFYPTNVMVNAHDILELWDSRMIMLSLYTFSDREIEKAIPFKDVYLTGLVKARDGQKMSKSKGNGVAPDELFEKYGVDATRMFFYHGNSAGRGYPINDEKLLNMKKFANKIWNASKFVILGLENLEKQGVKIEEVLKNVNLNNQLGSENSYELFIRNRSADLTKDMNEKKDNVKRKIEDFQFGYAAEDLYEGFWHEYCDKYIEDFKFAVNPWEKNKDEQKEARLEYKITAVISLYKALLDYLKLLHPMMPFITEKIWQSLPDAKGSLMFEKI